MTREKRESYEMGKKCVTLYAECDECTKKAILQTIMHDMSKRVNNYKDFYEIVDFLLFKL